MRLSFFGHSIHVALTLSDKKKTNSTASVRIFSANTHTHTRNDIVVVTHRARCHLLRIHHISRSAVDQSLFFCCCFAVVSRLYGCDAQYYISLLFGINVLLNTCTRASTYKWLLLPLLLLLFTLLSRSLVRCHRCAEQRSRVSYNCTSCSIWRSVLWQMEMIASRVKQIS